MGMGWETDSVAAAALASVALGFLWSLHRDVRNLSDRVAGDMRGLSERVAKVAGLLEGLRDGIANRPDRS